MGGEIYVSPLTTCTVNFFEVFGIVSRPRLACGGNDFEIVFSNFKAMLEFLGRNYSKIVNRDLTILMATKPFFKFLNVDLE